MPSVSFKDSSRPANDRRVPPRSGAARRAIGVREALSLLAAALGARRGPNKACSSPSRSTTRLGGHSERAADPETDLIRRIGRRRIATAHSAAAFQRTDT